MSLKTIKRGSDFYIFPSPFKNYKSLKLVLFWISKIVKSRREYLLLYRIKYELANILKYEGATWKHYKLFQKKVSENILYSHFRWV
jgi:ribosomal protein S7